MNTLTYLLLFVVVFWNAYVHCMSVYRAYLRKRLKIVPALLAAPIVALMLVCDVVAQHTLASLVFWEKPASREWLVTYRLRRHMVGPDGWRRRLAYQICHYLLDPFDPTGAHCDGGAPTLSGD